jgi:hypothetical protein
MMSTGILWALELGILILVLAFAIAVTVWLT